MNKFNLIEAEVDNQKPIVVNSPNTTIVVKEKQRRRRKPTITKSTQNTTPVDPNYIDPGYYEDELVANQIPQQSMDSPATQAARYYEDEPINANVVGVQPTQALPTTTYPSLPAQPPLVQQPVTTQPALTPSVTPPAMVAPETQYYEDELQPVVDPTQMATDPATAQQLMIQDPSQGLDMYEDEPEEELTQTIGNASEETSTPPIPTKDLSRLDNLKTIHATLLNIRNILNNESDKQYKDVKSKLNDSLNYFSHIVKNLDSYSTVIDDLIIKYKRFSFVLVNELDKIKKSVTAQNNKLNKSKPKQKSDDKKIEVKISKTDRDSIVSDIVKKLKFEKDK